MTSTTTTTATASTTTTVVVRYFAAARAAAGVESETVLVDTSTTPATVATVLDAVRAAHDPALTLVLARCSYLLDELAVRDPATPVPPQATLDVLPPFAGG